MPRLLAIALFASLTCACTPGEGPRGPIGADAEPCTVTENEDGSATIECPDGSTATVDAPSPTGCTVTNEADATVISCADGTMTTIADGTDGQDGAPGTDGTSCTVSDNGDGTITISCEDGTSVIVADGVEGTPGADGTSCTVADNGDGTSTISCEDGTSATISNGENGADGASCTVTDNGDGTSTISCEDGTSVTVADGVDGNDGTSCSLVDNGDGTATITCGTTSVLIGSARCGDNVVAGNEECDGTRACRTDCTFNPFEGRLETRPNATFSSAEPRYTSIVELPSGEVALVFRELTTATTRMVVYDATMSTKVAGPFILELTAELDAVVLGNGNVAVAYADPSDGFRGKLVTYDDRGIEQLVPVTFSTTAVDDIDTILLPNGNIFVAYGTSRANFAIYTPGGVQVANAVLSSTDSFEFAAAALPSGSAAVAWSEQGSVPRLNYSVVDPTGSFSTPIDLGQGPAEDSDSNIALPFGDGTTMFVYMADSNLMQFVVVNSSGAVSTAAGALPTPISSARNIAGTVLEPYEDRALITYRSTSFGAESYFFTIDSSGGMSLQTLIPFEAIYVPEVIQLESGTVVMANTENRGARPGRLLLFD